MTPFQLGFFDPEGYYFNPEGYDDLGGYYDSYGVYRDVDFGFAGEEKFEEDPYQDIAIKQHTDSVLPLLKNSPDSGEFTGVLSSLPYSSKKEEVEEELKKNKIEFSKVEPKLDPEGRLIKANVTMKSKQMAETLLMLHGKTFLGRKLKVEFPDYNLDLIIEETDLLKVEHNPQPKPKEEVKEKAKEEEKPKQEEVNEDGFIIEHFKSSNAPHRAKATMRYRRKPQQEHK